MTGPAVMGPTELLAHVDRICERYELGIIDPDDAAAALGRVHLVDADGSAWAVGARSRSWYRFREGRWVAAGRAPDPANLLSAGELLGNCGSCGSASGGGRFCGSCGIEQASGRLGVEAEPALASFLENGYDTLPEPLPERAARPEPAPTARPVPTSTPLATATPETTPSDTTTATTPTAATPEPRRPRARRIRSAVSTVLGAGLLVFSGSRLVLGLAGGGFEPPDVSPEPTFVGGGPAATFAGPEASVGLDQTMTPSDGPIDGSVWFADAFDSEGAWPTGDDGFLDATYDGGWYLLTVHPADLPVYRWAANEAAPGTALTVEASIVFETGGPTAVGLAVADAGAFNKLVVLLEPGGEWMISRDDVEAFETLMVGQAAEPVTPKTVHRLRIELDGAGMVSAWLDDVELGSAAAHLEVTQFGIAAWSVEDGGRVAVDDYLVTLP